jgi:hypothetical protein
MPHRRDDDRSLILIEDYTPVADPKPYTLTPLEALDIAMSSSCKFHQPLVDPTANVGREIRPLTRAYGGEGDRPHTLISHIAIVLSSLKEGLFHVSAAVVAVRARVWPPVR